MMEVWQQNFLEEAERSKVLSFGEFKLKSGRISPYFFNVGNFADGRGIDTLCLGYANLIEQEKIKFDVLFGAAYKGIPIVACLSLVLRQKFDINIPFCYNRKEIKPHGEGGQIVGATHYINAQTKVLIVDDVITAGTSISECLDILRGFNCQVVGVMVAINRQEVSHPKDPKKESVIKRMQNEFKLPIYSVVNLDTLINYLTKKVDEGETNYTEDLEKMNQYRSIYGSLE